VAARLGVAGRKAAIARLRAWLRAALREALPADLAGLPERLQRVP
jgi:hypothetical protein